MSGVEVLSRTQRIVVSPGINGIEVLSRTQRIVVPPNQAKLDAALGNDAEAAEAVARINEATAAIAVSGTILSTLDLDPANPQVPSPSSDEPTV